MAKRDDASRRKFLGALVTALGARWVAGFAEVKPFGVMGATLRREGVDGFVTVVPSVIENNVISWQPFPGTGHPHYDLRPGGVGLVRAHTLADAVTALERWVKTKQPLERGPAKPMVPLMRPILEAIARAPAPSIVDAVDPATWLVTGEGAAQLDAARAALEIATLVRAFPREDDGRIATTDVLLARVASTKQLTAGRTVHLIARGARPRTGHTITLVLEAVYDSNESHRWLDARWLWQAGVTPPRLDDTAREYVALADAGRFDAALALYGITLGPSAMKVFEGVPTSAHRADDAEWRTALRRALWSLAPWHLPKAGGRLALMPHQRQQVKSWLTWIPPGTLELQGTASNVRMAHTQWRRDLDVDLARLGIARAGSTAATVTVAKPSAKPLKPLVEMIVGKALWRATTAKTHAKARPHAVAELVGILESATAAPPTRANAMWIASDLVEPADGARIAAFLDDRERDVRRMAIEGVKRAGYVAATPVLARIVCATRTSDPALGVSAATALKVLGGVRGPRGLLRYFNSTDAREREAACHAFAIFHDGDKLGHPHLERMLLDPDPAVAAAARAAFTAIAKRS